MLDPESFGKIYLNSFKTSPALNTFHFYNNLQSATSASACIPKKCRNDCIARGATGGICQYERDGSFKCICSWFISCEEDTCQSDCIADGAGGGFCQVERDGSWKCMCTQ